jgi:2-polyprenyl-3-methyl-5-hydroxy-6-metoxy-1,4-benzoquinol methylase
MLPIFLLVLLLQSTQPNAAAAEFAKWRAQQPPQAQLVELYVRYREYLQQAGRSESEIAAAFLEIERERWDRTYSNPNVSFNTAPNAFLTEVVKTLKPGRALEIGMGQGRNSVYLAKLGWDVTGFDISETGMSLARKSAADAGVKLRTINKSIEEFDYGVDQWDLIVATYEGASWRDKAVRGLKPGGIVVVEGFLKGPQTPPGASFTANELVKMFLDLNLRILRYEDVAGSPDWGTREGHVIRLCAQKPE